MIGLPEKELKKLCQEYNIQLMIIFGSFIKDGFNSRSDIDLAITAGNIGLITKNRLQILDTLADLFSHRRIDLILLNHAEPLIKYSIARAGRLIYEEKQGLFNAFRVRAVSEHNDAQKFYELDKEYINNYLKGVEADGKQRVNPPQVK